MAVVVEDIDYFFKSNSRKDNDLCNRKREACYDILNNPGHAFYDVPVYGEKWQKLRKGFEEHIRDILTLKGKGSACHTFKLDHRGGLSNHNDFALDLNCEDGSCVAIPWEFKFNSVPQFANEPEKNCYIKRSLPDFWWESGYLDQIIALYPPLIYSKPTKTEYLVGAHILLGKKTDPAKFGFFKQFYDWERNDPKYGVKSAVYKKKQEITNKGLRAYLESHGSEFDVAKLRCKLQEDQKEKVYGAWNPKSCAFKCFEYSKEELSPSEFLEISNGNSVVLKAGNSTMRCLLRWKNTIGICMPAWQISLVKPKIAKVSAVKKARGKRRLSASASASAEPK